MGKPTGLVKRKGSNAYYCRLRYPPDVVKQLGRAEFIRTLGTGIHSEAISRLPTVRAEFDFEVATIRARAFGPQPTAPVIVRPHQRHLAELTNITAALLAKQHFAAAFLRMEREPLAPPQSEAWLSDLSDVESDLSILTDPEHPNTARWTEAEELTLLSDNQLRAEPTSPQSLLLRSYLRRSLLQLARLRYGQLHQDFSDRLTDAFFEGSTDPAAIVQPQGATLAEVCALFETEHRANEVSDKTLLKSKAALSVINRFFGPNTLVAAIDRHRCFEFRDLLAHLPPNLTKSHPSNSDLAKIVQLNTDAEGAVLGRDTQAFYLSVLRRVLETAKDRRFTAANEAERLNPKGRAKRREAARDPYSTAQLNRIFDAPLYRGCKDDSQGFAIPGPNVPKRSRFWLPLIALFSGLRLNEILQLTADHVLLDKDGNPYLFVSPDMQVKTDNSFRQVPIHHELLRVGFMQLADDAQNKVGKLLFDDVPPGADGYRSSNFSKRYRTFLRSLKLDEPSRKVSFHSFRHNFRDALRKNENSTDLVRELCGHSRGSEVSTAYGEGTPAHVLRPMVNAIDYQLDLSHL